MVGPPLRQTLKRTKMNVWLPPPSKEFGGEIREEEAAPRRVEGMKPEFLKSHTRSRSLIWSWPCGETNILIGELSWDLMSQKPFGNSSLDEWRGKRDLPSFSSWARVRRLPSQCCYCKKESFPCFLSFSVRYFKLKHNLISMH